jgi:phosphatidate phosphatase APP1
MSNEKTLQYLEKKNKSLYRKIKLGIKHKFGWLGVPKIIPYRGFGSAENVFITGYLTEDKGLEKPEENNSTWENILAMIKRYSSDEIPGALVEVSLNGEKQQVKTEETGLFRANFSGSFIQKEEAQWISYSVKLKAQLENELVAGGEILIPGTATDFGVISDVDDTIIVSHATQTLRKLRLMLFHNSRTRKPFPGVDAFYRALYEGFEGGQSNPFFYVSSSEWNLYDLIEDFCSHNKLPKGVFMLRELKANILKFWKSGGGDHQHKFRKIKTLFEIYPNMSFVLIGDNGQRDPEIYSRIAHEYPDRVKAIYIRTVRKSWKEKRIREMTQELQKVNIQIMFVKDTVEAAYHAAGEKLISSASIEIIRQDAEKDISG